MNRLSTLATLCALSWTVGLLGCSSDTENLADGGTLICTSDEQCPEDEHCAEQACVPDEDPTCANDGECEGALICVEMVCEAPQCTQNGECDDGFECFEGRCEAVGDTPCESDDMCTGDQICIGGSCESAVPCTDTSMCPNNLICTDGICREPCTMDEDCGSPQLNQCDVATGECQSRCIADRMCDEGEYCESNICVPAECTSDAECNPPGEICVGADEGRGRCEMVTPCGPNGDCPVGSACDDTTNRCEPLDGCRTDRDCGGDAYCEDGFCQPTETCTASSCATGFECIADICVPAICRADSDCTTPDICVAGACQPAPTTEFVTSIRIISPAGFVRPGTTYQFVALAQDQAGRVVPGAQISWTSSSTAVATIVAGGLATGRNDAGVTQVRATVQSSIGPVVSQPVDLTNIGLAPSAGVRVTVVRQDSGRPVADATVQVGTGGVDSIAVTDASGIASFPNVSGATFDITAVHAMFDWVSVLGSASNDVRIELPALNRTDRAAGARGTVDLSRVTTQGALSLSLSGASLASPLLTSDPGTVFGGEIFNAQVPMLGNVPVPAGNTVALEFQGFPITLKDTYYASAQPGLRALWSFGGKVDFGNSGLDIGDFQNLLAALLPFYQRFEHTVDPTVPMLALPKIVDSADIDADGDVTEEIADWNGFANRTLTPSQSQTLRYQLTVDNLPFVSGGNANTLIIMSGVILPGVGFVPLGIDGQSDSMGTGIVPSFITKMAPPHGGLEAGIYAVMTAAVRTDMTGPPGPGSARLFTADRLPASVDLSDGWIDSPVDTTVDLSARQATLPASPGTDLYHVAFANPEGTWHVYIPAAPGASTIDIPARPDLTLPPRLTSAQVTVDAVDLQATAPVGTLFDAAGAGALGLDRVTRGFARAIVQ